jgi:protocatechuate 3,4-dioxygenase beta subunit
MSRPAPLLLGVLFLGVITSARESSSPDSFAISGTITAASTGDGLRHARVFATAAAGSPPATLTDDRGRYTLAGLSAGRHVLTIVKPGYVRRTVPVDVPVRNAEGAGDAGNAGDVDAQLVKGAVISGVLIDELGEPVTSTSVTVQATGASDNVTRAPIVAVGQADDLGQFRVSGLAAGTYILEVTPGMTRNMSEDGPGMQTMIVGPTRRRFYYPGVNDPAAAQRLTVQAGDERAGLVMSVPAVPPFLPSPLNRPPLGPDGRPDPNATAIIKGRVIKPDGSPVRGAQVNATPVGGRPTTAMDATDSDGHFEIVLGVAPRVRGTEPPVFRVTAFKAGYQGSDFGQRNPTTRGDPFQIAPGEVHDHVDITLQPLGVLSGRVLDDIGEPVEGALVRPAQLRYVNGRRQLVDVGAPRSTDDLGRYRLYGLRPGQYAISASVGQIVVAQSSVDLPGFGTTYYPGTSDPQAIQFVRVDPSQEVSAMDFSLLRMRSARVAGRALDADGDPITGGIALMPSQRSGANTDLQMGARIDRRGGFEFRNVPPGDYVLQVVHGRHGQWNEGEFAYQYISVSDADITDLEMQTNPGSALTGHIVAEGGELSKMDGLELSAIPVDIDRAPRLGGPPARANITPDSQFELAGITGPRRLQVVRAPSGWMLKSILVHGVDVTDQVMFFGRDDESLDDIEVVLTNRITQVLGSVSDSRGLTPSDVAVLAFATDSAQWYPGTRFRKRTSPSSDGRFSIDGLPPGDYFVVAAAPPRDPGEWLNPDTLEKLSRGATRVHLSDGQRVSVTVKPGGS